MRTQWIIDPLAKAKPPNPGRYGTAARVVYLALDPMTALQEVQAFGLPLAHAFVPVTVTLNAVIDVHDPKVAKVLSISTFDLSQNFRTAVVPTPAQELGDACEAFGKIDAILYRSLTKGSGGCLAVLAKNLPSTKGVLTVADASLGAHAVP